MSGLGERDSGCAGLAPAGTVPGLVGQQALRVPHQQNRHEHVAHDVHAERAAMIQSTVMMSGMAAAIAYPAGRLPDSTRGNTINPASGIPATPAPAMIRSRDNQNWLVNRSYPNA